MTSGEREGLITAETRRTVIEQGDFTYWFCSECEFDCVHRRNEYRRIECPMCAGDTGHNNMMFARLANADDKPEGCDARETERPA